MYTAVVIGGWAAAEALADMYELENGRTVPLIKKKGDWYTSVNGKTFGSEFLSAVEINVDEEERNITGASDLLALDYREYLRLLLLQVPERVKLYRIQDLIELNLYKKTNSRMYIGDFYTGIKCSAEFIIGTIIVVDDYGRKRYISEVKSYACT